MGLRIKALNVDNALEVRALIGLFDRAAACGTNAYPAVLNEEFWQTRVPRQLTSIVALEKNVVRAHLALSVEELDGHVLFAVSDPQVENGADLLAQMWQVLRNSPRMTNLRSLTITIPQGSPAVEEFAKLTLGARLSCLLPSHTPGAADSGATILGTCSQHERLPDTLKLRIPTRYRPFATQLFAEFGILATFLDIAGAPRAVSADAQSVVRYAYRDIGAEHLFIEPSLLNGWRELKLDPDLRSYLFIDARDPKCADMCDAAEEHGYVFSGFLPLVFGRTSIVFSPAPLVPVSAIAFDDDRIQELAENMSGEQLRPARQAVANAGRR
ncbi:MAG: hypothetical protein K1X79_02155 [Oligoflexia bacterium]|nr:hypothetical protein [Oligoflexia bacterium]